MSLYISIAQQLEEIAGELLAIRTHMSPSQTIPWMTFHTEHSVGTRPYTLEEDRRFRLAYFAALPVKSQHQPYPTEYAARVALLRRGCLYYRDGFTNEDCPHHFGLESAQCGGVDLSKHYCYACRHHYLGLPVERELYCHMKLSTEASRPPKKARTLDS